MAEDPKTPAAAAPVAQGVTVAKTQGKQSFTRNDCIRLGLDPTAYGYKKATAAEIAGAEGEAEGEE